MPGSGSTARRWILAILLACGLASVDWAQAPSQRSPQSAASFERAALQRFVTQRCSSCHNHEVKSGGLALEALVSQEVAANTVVWEKVVRKLAARQMPPLGQPR